MEKPFKGGKIVRENFHVLFLGNYFSWPSGHDK